MSAAAYRGPKEGGVAYLVTNTVTGKRYIGITRQRPGQRWLRHKHNANQGGDGVLCRSIRKHGPAAFTFEVIACARSHEDLCALEQMLIAQHGTFWEDGCGYNLTRGGDGQVGRRHSEETRRKMSASRKGVKKSEAWVAQRKGQPRPQHVIDALRASNVGRPKSEAQHAALRAANAGRTLSEAHKAKLSAATRAWRARTSA